MITTHVLLRGEQVIAKGSLAELREVSYDFALRGQITIVRALMVWEA